MCIDPPGFDAGKLIKGKKRYVLVDPQGLLLHGQRSEDRDGGLELLAILFGLFPFLGKLFADSAYQGPVFHGVMAGILPHLETEIIKRSNRVKGFVVQPRRWVVEHTIPGSTAPPIGQGLGKPQPHPPRHGSSTIISDSLRGTSQDIVIERRA